MKTIKKLSILLLSAVILTGCANGCKSTPQQVAYQTAGTTIVSVDQAMKLWGAYVKAAHPPVGQEQDVKAAFLKYQASMLVVCDAGAAWSQAVTPDAQLTAANALQIAVTTATENITDLENLIRQFGVKL